MLLGALIYRIDERDRNISERERRAAASERTVCRIRCVDHHALSTCASFRINIITVLLREFELYMMILFFFSPNCELTYTKYIHICNLCENKMPLDWVIQRYNVWTECERASKIHIRVYIYARVCVCVNIVRLRHSVYITDDSLRTDFKICHKKSMCLRLVGIQCIIIEYNMTAVGIIKMPFYISWVIYYYYYILKQVKIFHEEKKTKHFSLVVGLHSGIYMFLCMPLK